MAPTTKNMTTAISDALNQARAATDSSSPVNINLITINPTVEPTATPSAGPFTNTMLNSILTFFAALSNIWLGLGGVIVVILFLVRVYKERKWPRNPQEEQVELTSEHLETTKRMESGILSIDSSARDHHDLQARQMDLLLQCHGVKDRPCLHPRWECHLKGCPPERNRRYDAWEYEKRGWSEYGSQESLVDHGGAYEQQLKPDVEQQSGGAELGREKALVDSLPSGWVRVSESVVENESVKDWGSHENMVWMGGPEESLLGLPLYQATTKLKSS